VQYDFPNEEIVYLKMKDCDEPFLEEGPEPGSRWGMVFDGAVNQYGNGIGAVIITPQGTHLPFTTRLTFKCTNNMAEYEACIMGLEEAMNLRIKYLDVFGDSALVVNQIKGEWETNQPGLIPYRDYARRISTFFTKVEFHHIPRDENQMADALTTLASMIVVKYWNEVPNLSVMRPDRPAHVFAVEEIKDEKPWYYDVKCFLQSQIYPPGASLKDKKTLRRLAGNFYLNGDILYKRNFDMVLLRCVDRHEADLLMTEVHEGSFGTHSSGDVMAKKMLRAGIG
jgi:ribonuclease HI